MSPTPYHASIETFLIWRDNITIVTSASSMALSASVLEDVLRHVFIVLGLKSLHWLTGTLGDYDNLFLYEMETYLPKMSLKQSDGNVYLSIQLNAQPVEMALECSTVYLDTIYSISPMSCALSIVSNTIGTQTAIGVTAESMGMALYCPVLNVSQSTICGGGTFEISMADSITENCELLCYAEGSYTTHLETSITEDLEMWRGIEWYDNDLLVKWDSWTLYDMAEATRIS